jgi:hypothetical protein
MSLEQNSVDAAPRWPRPKASADRWLSLAAAPTFAVMALLTSMPGGGPTDILCSAAGGSPLGGMIPMYLLMSAFHSAPWLRLIAKAWRSAAVAAKMRSHVQPSSRP